MTVNAVVRLIRLVRDHPRSRLLTLLLLLIFAVAFAVDEITRERGPE
jgi:hypothetical protein